MCTSDVFALAMLIKVSMPHVTGSIAPVTAQKKPMLRKKNMKLLLVILALNFYGCLGVKWLLHGGPWRWPSAPRVKILVSYTLRYEVSWGLT